MKTEIEAATAVLMGKPLWTCRRAASMANFQFGKRKKTQDSHGKPTEVGEYALHVDCAWRITRAERVVVGSRDLWYPAEFDNDAPVPADFDWSRSLSRRDKILDALFEGNTREFSVQRVEGGLAGSLRIDLSDGLSLEVFPDDSLEDEYWRLLAPDQEKPHFVVRGRGIDPGPSSTRNG